MTLLCKSGESLSCTMVSFITLHLYSPHVAWQAQKYKKTRKSVGGERSRVLVVQSRNSLFRVPFIGQEPISCIGVKPKREKRESRITCMLILRTNQSETRSVALLLAWDARARVKIARSNDEFNYATKRANKCKEKPC